MAARLLLGAALAALLAAAPLLPPPPPPPPATPSGLAGCGRGGGGALVTVSLHSLLNATGHRVLTARASSEGGPRQQLMVDVSQGVARGGASGTEVLTLSTVVAVITEPEPAAEAAEAAAEAAEAAEAAAGAGPAEKLEDDEMAEAEAESAEAAEAVVADGPAPDAEFEEVRYADYERAAGGEGGRYKLHTRAAAWPEADRACRAEHAHLLVADTAAEAAAARLLLRRRRAAIAGAHRTDIAFVGASDAAREGHYVTVTGKNLTSLAFHSWHAKEPSKGRHQNWVGLDIEGRLHDIPNHWKLAFLCEAP